MSTLRTTVIDAHGAERLEETPMRTNSAVAGTVRIRPDAMSERTSIPANLGGQPVRVRLRYNHHRTHTALGGHPPISRLAVNNVPGQNN
jgi:hypothetical protein